MFKKIIFMSLFALTCSQVSADNFGIGVGVGPVGVGIGVGNRGYYDGYNYGYGYNDYPGYYENQYPTSNYYYNTPYYAPYESNWGYYDAPRYRHDYGTFRARAFRR